MPGLTRKNCGCAATVSQGWIVGCFLRSRKSIKALEAKIKELKNSQIIQNNKTNLEAQEERLKCLEKEIVQSKEILSGLIKNLDNKENKED